MQMKEEFKMKCGVKQMVEHTSIYTKKNSQFTSILGQLTSPFKMCTLMRIELTILCAVANPISISF